MAITYNVGLDARFEKRILRKVGPAAFVAPRNPLSKKMRLTLKEVSDHPLVLSDEGLSVQHFLNLFEAEGLQPEIRHRTRSVEAMRSLAANGAGIGLSYTTPPGSVAYDGEHLVSIPIADKAGEEAVLLVTLAEQTGDHWLRSAADCLIRELA